MPEPAAPPRSTSRPPRTIICGLAAGALALGTLDAYGNLRSQALVMIVMSVGIAALALRDGTWEMARGFWAALVGGVALLNMQYPIHPPNPSFVRNVGAQMILTVGFSALLAVAAWLPGGRRAWTFIGGAVVTFVVLVAVTWSWNFAWGIDVFTGLSQSTDALLRGHNPYGPVLMFYVEPQPLTPSFVAGHFPYGPIVPVLAIPGQLLGDARLMSGVAVAALIVALWVLARQGAMRAHAHRIVALAIACPLTIGMLTESWVDTYMMAALAGWFALRRTHRRWAIACLAVAFLVKPTALIVVVPAVIWSRRARIEVAAAGVCAAIFALPFALATGIGRFVYDVAGVQLAFPPRYGALTLTSLLWQSAGVVLPGFVTFVAVLVGIVLISVWGRPRDEADLALQVVILATASFILSKWAFFNYYYISFVMVMVAMAGAGVGFERDELRLPGMRRPSRPEPRTA